MAKLPTVAVFVLLAAAVTALQLAHTPAAHAQPPAAAKSQDPNAPRVVTQNPATSLMNYYPTKAAQRKINGDVLLAVTLDSQSHATGVRVLSEQPADEGFGTAASKVANELEYSNPTGQPAELTFSVHFRLGGPGSVN